MKILFLPVFLLIIPAALGLPWCCIISKNSLKRTLACVPTGFFLELAILQLLTIPFAYLHLSFSLLCNIYIGALIVFCFLSVAYQFTSKKYRFPKASHKGWVYECLFYILLCYQIYNAITLDRTYMSYDDATYVAIANDALMHNTLYSIDPYTGVGSILNLKRVMQSSLIFPSFLSYVSGINVVTMEHTILDIYFLLLAYAVYAYLGSALFAKQNIPAFLTVIALLFIFGNYSMYSQTMRLLGLNYPGKALLAVVFCPLLFTLLVDGLNANYKASFGCLLLLLSAAASGMTLFGAAIMIICVTISVLLSLLPKARDWRKVKYILYAGIIPALYIGLFGASKFYWI